MEAYYYSQLDKKGAAVYHALLKGLTALEDEFLIPAYDMKDLSELFVRLRLDHPEIFWATSFKCKYYQDSPNLIFVPEYLFTKNKIRDHQKALDARKKKLVQPMLKMNETEKEKYVHDFICSNIQYDKLKKAYSHEIIGPLGHGVGVCEGIAKSVKLLLDEAGVWNIIVLCGNNPEKGIKYGHAWNLVRVNGKYYHLDTTFDNTLTKNANGEIRYDYFNLADTQIFRDHEPVKERTPQCQDSDHFYYRENKLSFTKQQDIYNRIPSFAKKERPLTFHWRGGYFTRDICLELAAGIKEAASSKNKKAKITVNFAQAIMRVSFVESEPSDEIVMEDTNISEHYEEAQEA